MKARMVLDSHIHIQAGPVDSAALGQAFAAAGVDGGIVISQSPPSFGTQSTAGQRLDNLFAWKGELARVYPFFWVDPLEPDAIAQVQMAHARGVSGYKVICNRFFPGDERAMTVYAAIAGTGKPLLFHSGILWDGTASSQYNRPAEFEPLFDVKDLRFALAHVSWPWFDECIAVFGKFQNSYDRSKNPGGEMFIDLTPGTPPIYRQEVLTKLFTVGYNVADSVVFGSDRLANCYDVPWLQEWQQRDNTVYAELGITQDVLDKVYAENLLRFLGVQA